MSKEKTEDEVREEFLAHIRMLVKYWNTQPDRDCEGKLNGLAFSILAMLDGCSTDICGFIVAPHVHEDDKQHCIEHGEDYYPQNHESNIKGDIAGGLHDLFYKN